MSATNSGKQRGRPFAPGQSGNPKGRPRRDAAATRADGWLSLTTGHGTSRDRATSFVMVANRLPYEHAREIYRGDGVAARAVNLLPAAMLRKGIGLAVQSQDGVDGQAVQQALIDRLDELQFASRVKLALQWARAFGGSAILLGANDGSPDLSVPLNLDRVVSLDWLTVLTCRELQPWAWYDDPRHPKYGEPSVYNIVATIPTSGGSMQRVHESRLLRFDGVKLTREEERANLGWGDSVLVRLHEALRDFGAAWGGAAHLLSEYGQGVLTIPGLLEMTKSKDASETLSARLLNFEMLRSTVRAAVLDGGAEGVPGETFTRLQTPLAGVADMFDRFDKRIASIAGVPVSLLTGESLSGLNASGGVNAGWWDDDVAAAREDLLRPPANRVVKLLFRCKSGPTRGVEPESWRVVFPPLRELTAKEKADIRLVDAQADQIHANIDVLDPAEIATKAYGGAEYSSDRTIDLDTRDALASDDEPVGEDLPTVGAGQPGATEPAAASALNGAQVAALVNIISQVAQRQIPRESGIGIVLASFPLSESQAEAIMGEAGRSFVPSMPGEAGAPT